MSGSAANPADISDRDDLKTPPLMRQHQIDQKDRAERAKLNDPKRSRAAYCERALLAVLPAQVSSGTGKQKRKRRASHVASVLSATECRALLHLALRYARGDLSNAFPSQRRAAGELGMQPRAYHKLIAALQRKGWIRAHATAGPNGRQTSNGYQFRLPPGILPKGEPWEGPVSFKRRCQSPPNDGAAPSPPNNGAAPSPPNNGEGNRTSPEKQNLFSENTQEALESSGERRAFASASN